MSYVLICIHSFKAETENEIDLITGDIVLSTNPFPIQGWVKVTNTKNNQTGYVPFEFLNLTNEKSIESSNTDQKQLLKEDDISFLNVPNKQQISTSSNYNYPTVTQPNDLYKKEKPISTSNCTPMMIQNLSSNPFDSVEQYQNSHLPNESTSAIQNHEFLNRPEQTDSSLYSANIENLDSLGFQDTLELWRNRERRFMKGEKEVLPKATRRVYFLWDSNGVKHGPFFEEKLRKMLQQNELLPNTQIGLVVNEKLLNCATVKDSFPDINQAFIMPPLIKEKSNESMWLYKDFDGVVHGPFPASQMREWFQEGFFNAESLVKLANNYNEPLVQLGFLFPEGKGAFLSDGDQIGAIIKQDKIKMSGIPNYQTHDLSSNQPNLQSFNPQKSNNVHSNEMIIPYNNPSNEYKLMNPSSDFFPYLKKSFSSYPTENEYISSNSADYFYSTPMYRSNSVIYDNSFDISENLLHAYSSTFTNPISTDVNSSWQINWDNEPKNFFDSSSTFNNVDYFDKIEKSLETPKTAYHFLMNSLDKSFGLVKCQVNQIIQTSPFPYRPPHRRFEFFLKDKHGKCGKQLLTAENKSKFGINRYYAINPGSASGIITYKAIFHLNYNILRTNFLCYSKSCRYNPSLQDIVSVYYPRQVSSNQPRALLAGIPPFENGSESEQARNLHLSSRNNVLLEELKLFYNNRNLSNSRNRNYRYFIPFTLKPYQSTENSKDDYSPSEHNYQLVLPNQHNIGESNNSTQPKERTVLKNNQVGINVFDVDIGWPLSPVAAFSIIISSSQR